FVLSPVYLPAGEKLPNLDLFMLRAVLDTNILLAAFWSPTGASHQIFRELLAGKWIAVIENHLVTEYDEVLKRHSGDLRMTFAEIDAALDGLCVIAERWKLSPGWIPILRDPDDEPILQLAVEAGVRYVVSRNVRDFDGAGRFSIEILQPAAFLKLVRQPRS
ncbi:MAG: PIN domain-containing protein, partial [Verrucomicrobiae bacterium]|nr:PIN domain-containing protein [Verrucomicrobiae bacterium]